LQSTQWAKAIAKNQLFCLQVARILGKRCLWVCLLCLRLLLPLLYANPEVKFTLDIEFRILFLTLFVI
jgi:hypothetical protein